MMRRLGNTFVRALLRSPLHGLLSGSLLLVTYTGRKSGRTFTIPVMYADDGGDLLVYAGHSAEKVWWRNLRGGAPAELRVSGKRLAVRGEVIEGRDEALEGLPPTPGVTLSTPGSLE